MRIRWIDQYNFGELEGHELNTGLNAFAESSEDFEYKIDYNALIPAQKKRLPGMDGEFKVYCNEKSRPPSSLKSRVVKERFFPKKDIIPLVKMILKEKDRDKVFEALMREKISPIVLEIWLLRPFSASKKALAVLVEASQYIYSNHTYYTIIASKYMPGDPNVCFKFPKKIRE